MVLVGVVLWWSVVWVTVGGEVTTDRYQASGQEVCGPILSSYDHSTSDLLCATICSREVMCDGFSMDKTSASCLLHQHHNPIQDPNFVCYMKVSSPSTITTVETITSTTEKPSTSNTRTSAAAANAATATTTTSEGEDSTASSFSPTTDSSTASTVADHTTSVSTGSISTTLMQNALTTALTTIPVVSTTTLAPVTTVKAVTPPTTTTNTQLSTTTPSLAAESLPPTTKTTSALSTTTPLPITTTIPSTTTPLPTTTTPPPTTTTTTSSTTMLLPTTTTTSTPQLTTTTTTTSTLQPTTTSTTTTTGSGGSGTATLVNDWFECPADHVVTGLGFDGAVSSVNHVLCTHVEPNLGSLIWTTIKTTGSCGEDKLPTGFKKSSSSVSMACTGMTSAWSVERDSCSDVNLDSGSRPVVGGLDTNAWDHWAVCSDGYAMVSGDQSWGKVTKITCCLLHQPSQQSLIVVDSDIGPTCLHQGQMAVVALGISSSYFSIEHIVCSTFTSALATLTTDVSSATSVSAGHEDNPTAACPLGTVIAGFQSAVGWFSEHMSASCVTVTGAMVVDENDCVTLNINDGSRPTVPNEDTSGWSNWLTCLHLGGDYVAKQVIRNVVKKSWNWYERKVANLVCCRLL